MLSGRRGLLRIDEFVELVAAADRPLGAYRAQGSLSDGRDGLSVGVVQLGERLFGDARRGAHEEYLFSHGQRSRFDQHFGHRYPFVEVGHLAHVDLAPRGCRSVMFAVFGDGSSCVVAFPESAVEDRSEPLFQSGGQFGRVCPGFDGAQRLVVTLHHALDIPAPRARPSIFSTRTPAPMNLSRKSTVQRSLGEST